ncbi:MAG: methyltransferase domain-containing protein [Thermomicrobiales bacterium]|nr:methyltransferase domain-containing protein [Thermomicrobiales bacterium]
MPISGLPLSEHLPAPRNAAILLLGGDDELQPALERAGYRVDRHALDTGPLAQLAGLPLSPPVVAWPFPDAAYDAVILLDELALTVQEEATLAEAARVLHPGGILLLRVPAAGRLAWLDGFNAYRYLRETSRRGCPLPQVEGTGWRRHYPREDLEALLRPHFHLRAIRGSGVGFADAARLGLLLYWRWARTSDKGDAAIACVPRRVMRLEGRVNLAGRGYSLVAAAERRSPDVSC